MTDAVEIRPIEVGDTEFLWEMVYWAAHVDEDDGVSRDDIRSDPDLIGHVDDWGRDGDIGLVAHVDDRLVGAAWLRLMVPGISDFSVFVDEHTPELVIAISPDALGRGIGSLLLRELFERADDRYATVVLSSRADNPAVRLYERFGFVVTDRIVNRVGTESVKMIRSAPGDA